MTGDTYIKMEHGPVPSKGYNLVKHDDRALREDQELFDDFIDVQGNDIRAKADSNVDVLSDSDIEVLEHTAIQYGKLTASQLRKLSHREAAWEAAEDNADMDYRLCFRGQQEAKSIWDLAQSDQELRDAIGNVEFEEFNGVALQS